MQYRGGEQRVHNLGRTRSLRKDATDAEAALWKELRAGRLEGHKFRRQHEFGGFILDFFSSSARLAIEVDGGQHLSDDGLSRDAERTRFLEANGVRVLRFTNVEVLAEIEGVKLAILQTLAG